MSYYSKILLHIVLMIGFLIFTISGIIIARYYKMKNSNWLKFHKTLMISGLVSGITGIAWIVFVIQIDSGMHLTISHHILGFIAALFVIGTMVLGFKLMSPNTDNSNKSVLRKIHKFEGRLSLLLIIVSAFSGLLFFGIIPLPF